MAVSNKIAYSGALVVLSNRQTLLFTANFTDCDFNIVGKRTADKRELADFISKTPLFDSNKKEYRLKDKILGINDAGLNENWAITPITTKDSPFNGVTIIPLPLGYFQIDKEGSSFHQATSTICNLNKGKFYFQVLNNDHAHPELISHETPLNFLTEILTAIGLEMGTSFPNAAFNKFPAIEWAALEKGEAKSASFSVNYTPSMVAKLYSFDYAGFASNHGMGTIMEFSPPENTGLPTLSNWLQGLISDYRGKINRIAIEKNLPQI